MHNLLMLLLMPMALGAAEDAKPAYILHPFIIPRAAIEPIALLDELTIEPENRCAPYERRDYAYPQSIEQEIVSRQGMVSYYTGKRECSAGRG